MRGERRYPRLAIATCLVALLAGGLPPAAAKVIYPHVASDSRGTWIATDTALVNIVGDLWVFYGRAAGLCSDRVRAVAPDEREVWAATPHGLGRMDRSSRRWECLGRPQLPATDVHSVAVDDLWVWIATAAGLVRFDKVRRTYQQVLDAAGPGRQPVYDVVSLGSTVWFSARDGVYRYDRQTAVWRRFGPREGFDLGPAYEVRQAGESLWFFCRDGLLRYDLRSEAVSSFGRGRGLRLGRISAFASVQGEIWLGGDGGLEVYTPGADAISPFIYTSGMPAGAVTGIVVALPWVWVSTTSGLGRFNTLQKVWEEKREEDGLAGSDVRALAPAGSTLVVLLPEMMQGYLVQRDDWVDYDKGDILSGRAGQRSEPSAWRLNLELTLSGEVDLSWPDGGDFSHQVQVVPALRLGAGRALDGGRTLDMSVYLDLGDATTSGVRDYDAELRLRGGPGDSLRELLLSDEVPIRPEEKQRQILDATWLEGLGLRQSFGRSGSGPAVELEAEAGLRRGVRTREFFRGSIDLTYSLAHPYLTPGSDVVKVDGMILERGVDYIITHTTGQLTFLNPDAVNALSVVEITYTYEQVPRKATASGTLLEMLPWDNEIGGFSRSGPPVYVTDETGLYQQIDGAAPKYIDRGWTESIFASYRERSTEVGVQIHDMGTPEQARDLFDYDRPASYIVLFEQEDALAVLDQGLPSGYAVKLWMDRYYVELSIDEKSRSAEILIGLFASAIYSKSSLAGSLRDSLRPLLAHLQLDTHPLPGLSVGAGYLASQDLEDQAVSAATGVRPARYQLALVDWRLDRQIGSGPYGGRLVGYAQLARSNSGGAAGPLSGRAAAGNILYNGPALNLRLDGEVQSGDFDTLGSRQTALGTFAGQVAADGTWQPLPWLRARLVYDHQRSTPPGGDWAAASAENLLGKLQFMRRGWPTLWLLGARSLLRAQGVSDAKWRAAGSLEYDMAHGVLSFLGMRKLTVKAYFDHSQNEQSGDAGAGTPEVLAAAPGLAQNMRLELKAAPTRTEDGYARFERKVYRPREGAAGALPLESWELVLGAVSRALDGVVPSMNGKLSHSDTSEQEGDALVQVERAQSLLFGQVELFPGRWVDALDTLQLAAGYGYTDTEEARNRSMQVHAQRHHVEGRLAWGRYDAPFRLESRGRWWRESRGEHQAVAERSLELNNRITYRPIYTSPITLRFDVGLTELVPPETGRSGSRRNFLPSLEWERRWSTDLVTRLRLEAPVQLADDFPDETLGVELSYGQWTLRPWAEVRLSLRDFWRGSLLRLTGRLSFGWSDWFRSDTGAEQAWELQAALWIDWERAGSFILRLGSIYTRHRCLERVDIPCSSRHLLQPSIKAIARF